MNPYNNSFDGSYYYSVAAIRTMAGFVGQILFDGEIVWESTPVTKPEDAAELARNVLIARAKKAFR